MNTMPKLTRSLQQGRKLVRDNRNRSPLRRAMSGCNAPLNSTTSATSTNLYPTWNQRILPLPHTPMQPSKNFCWKRKSCFTLSCTLLSQTTTNWTQGNIQKRITNCSAFKQQRAFTFQSRVAGTTRNQFSVMPTSHGNATILLAGTAATTLYWS